MTKTNIFSILPLVLIMFCTYGQVAEQIKTKEIKISYADGSEVFRICVTNPQMNYKDDKKYTWYTEFSNIKTTKGGSGGNLLHGNYKLFDELGNLRSDKNYYLGLQDGTEKNWDSLGNISSQAKYNKGEWIYWKFQNDSKCWVEHIGPVFKEGMVTKKYSLTNSLVSVEIMLPHLMEHTKIYYEKSGKIRAEYTCSFGDLDYMVGPYTTFYENGKKQIAGQYYDGYMTNIRIGTWTWYNEDGSVESTEQYKVEVERWPNGKIKVAGGYYKDSNTNWIKTGKWIWYTEEGRFQAKKNYKEGEEVRN